MKWGEFISSALGIPVNDFPKGYQKIGDIILLNLPKKLYPKKRSIGEKTLEFLPEMKTVCLNKSSIRGEFRLPEIEVIAGDSTETIHKEDGYCFFLDVRKVMFSKGNIKERMRMKDAAKGIVLDMFAGIGYFSIPASMGKKVKIVHAIEKNPDSFRFLLKNIELNKANVKPHQGDCKDVLKKNRIRADTIIMGLLPTPIDFLETALGCAKKKATIFFHTIHDVDKDLKVLKGKLRDMIENCGFRLNSISTKRIKKYGPRVEHLVIELFVTS